MTLTERQSARKSKTKNGRLTILSSNPLVAVPILELWAKIGQNIVVLRQRHHVFVDRQNDDDAEQSNAYATKVIENSPGMMTAYNPY